MVKIKHLLWGLFLMFLLLGIACWLTRSFWREQFHAYAIGTPEVACEKYGNLLPEIDKVEFSIIGPDILSSVNGFPERGEKLYYHPIVSQKAIVGKEAKEFAASWRMMTFGTGYSGLCHDPAYGLRFFDNRKLVFETTFCWHCANFSVPTPLGYTYCGFDEKTPQAKAVWELMQKHAPLPEVKGQKRSSP